jgi:hypothetical protein
MNYNCSTSRGPTTRGARKYTGHGSCSVCGHETPGRQPGVQSIKRVLAILGESAPPAATEVQPCQA